MAIRAPPSRKMPGIYRVSKCSGAVHRIVAIMAAIGQTIVRRWGGLMGPGGISWSRLGVGNRRRTASTACAKRFSGAFAVSSAVQYSQVGLSRSRKEFQLYEERLIAHDERIYQQSMSLFSRNSSGFKPLEPRG